MANFDPRVAETSEPIQIKLATVDYVRDLTLHANFGGRRGRELFGQRTHANMSWLGYLLSRLLQCNVQQLYVCRL